MDVCLIRWQASCLPDGPALPRSSNKSAILHGPVSEPLPIRKKDYGSCNVSERCRMFPNLLGPELTPAPSPLPACQPNPAGACAQGPSASRKCTAACRCRRPPASGGNSSRSPGRAISLPSATWTRQLGDGPRRRIRYGYTLLSVIMLSNLMAILLQALSARLGIVSGRDLAQACRDHFSRPVTLLLWMLCEIAIAACDLAE